MVRRRQAPGGGVIIEIEPRRLAGWVTRFGHRHGDVRATEVSLRGVVLTAADGATASMAAPFAPMDPEGAEAVEALIRHTEQLGDIAIVLVRARAYSVGIARGGEVIASSTDTRYVQGRTKAGGWSQQRYARRRLNQRRDAHRSTIEAATRMVDGAPRPLGGLVMGGDAAAIRDVIADPSLAGVAQLPRRTLADVREPRRAVLDEVARRCLTVEITVREPDATART